MSDTDPIDPFKPKEPAPKPEPDPEFDHAGTFSWPSGPASYPDKVTEEIPAKHVKWSFPWNHPATRIVCFYLLFFCCFVVIGLPFAFLSILQPIARDHSILLLTGLEACSALAVLWFMITIVERRKMRDAGFVFRGVVNETIAGTMIGISVISVTFGILAMLGAYHIVGENPSFRPWGLLLAYLFVAIAEETVFRGFTFRVLEYRYGSFVALVVSALIFGLVHVSNELGMNMPAIKEMVGPLFISFEAGLLLTAAYMATRRLWLPIGIHWAWNYFEGPIYGAQVSGMGSTDSLLRANLQGRFLMTGGPFGPEASVVCLIVCTLAGLLLLRVAIRAGQWHPAKEWEPASLPEGSS